MKTSFVARHPLRWRRAVLFRVTAVLLGFIPFLLLELILRTTGLGQFALPDDPFVGFSSVRPLFERTATGDRYEIAASRQTHFVADSFAVPKGPHEFRIFCIGDSTVQGNPWSTETSFTTWLEISLNAADPARNWNVVNCGGISYASYRMVPILEEVLRYQPDLVIVHCSHNEFLEDRTYRDLKNPPRPWRLLHEQVARFRLYGALRSSMQYFANQPAARSSLHLVDLQHPAPGGSRALLPAEVEALLDYRGGLELYHHDEVWQRGVIAHYEFNLRRMASIAHRAGVPLLLLNPGCQLRDTPPFKAEHRANLPDNERQRWNELWAEARGHYSHEPRQAVQLLRDAMALDDQHAGLHYDLAKCLDAVGQFVEARAEYAQAKDLDACPLRILSSMNEIVLRVGRETNTPVVDLRAMFDRISRNGIPGSEWFADHVHPTIPGYQRIADEIANEMVERHIVHPQPEWLGQKQQRYREHLDSLPISYFVQAQQRLEALLLWANGRAAKVRDD